MKHYTDDMIRDFAKKKKISYVEAYKAFERWSVGLFTKYAQAIDEFGGLGSGNFGHSGRLGEVGGSAPGGGGGVKVKEAKSLSTLLSGQGGFSYSTAKKSAPPSKGFMISPYKDREFILGDVSMDDKEKIKNIIKYSAKNKDLFKKKEHYFGGWVDNGKIYLDVAIRKEDEREAFNLAKQHNQLAVFNLENMESVNVT